MKNDSEKRWTMTVEKDEQGKKDEQGISDVNLKVTKPPTCTKSLV